LQGIVDLRHALKDGADSIDELQSLYRRMPPQFVNMASLLPTQPGVRLLSDVINELQQTNSNWLGDNYRCYRKALELLHAVVCQKRFLKLIYTSLLNLYHAYILYSIVGASLFRIFHIVVLVSSYNMSNCLCHHGKRFLKVLAA